MLQVGSRVRVPGSTKHVWGAPNTSGVVEELLSDNDLSPEPEAFQSDFGPYDLKVKIEAPTRRTTDFAARIKDSSEGLTRGWPRINGDVALYVREVIEVPNV